MLKQLFTSNARIKLLTVFLMNPNEEFFIRELTRKLDEQINSVRRELNNLKKVGLLRSKTKNRKKYYCVNKEFMLFEDLRSIFLKVLSNKHTFARDIAKMGLIKLIVLSGQFVNRETDSVDMLIVGAIDKQQLADYINSELRTPRPVKFSIMSEEDYNYRLNCRDKFITDLINDPTNEIPINKIS